MRLLPGLDEFFEPREEYGLMERGDGQFPAGSHEFYSPRRDRPLPFVNLSLLLDRQFLNPPVRFARVLFVLAGEEDRLLDFERLPVLSQPLQRLPGLDADERVRFQMKTTVRLDNDCHFPSAQSECSIRARYNQ